MTDIALIREHLADVDTTAICDADKGIRVMSASITCRSGGHELVGPAFTVRCRDDFFPVLRAVEDAAPGDVIVVAGGGREVALAGELFTRAALARGLAGIVVDGGYRDMDYVGSCALPVFSRYVTPMAGTATELGELQVTVECGGVTVSPGDIVIADANGLIVVDPASAMSVLASAAEVKATEARVITHLDLAGTGLSDCLDIAGHRERLARGESSSLSFTV